MKSILATAKKFTRAARKPQEETFDFEREVLQVWRDFPQVKDKVFFLDASNDARLVYPEESAGRAAAEALLHERDAVQRMKNTFASWGMKNSYCQPIGEGRRLLYVLREKHPFDKISPRAPQAQETAFVFDHELGHAIIPHGIGISANLSECVADAYATIRHFQRYGADSPHIAHIVNNRAFDFIFRDRDYGFSHFTSSVTEKILSRRHEIDWKALTPQETLELAEKFALGHAMKIIPLSALQSDFYAVRMSGQPVAQGNKPPLKKLAEKVLSTDSADVFKYGSAALALYVDKETADKVLKGKYWDDVRRKLAIKRKSFTQPPSPKF